MPSRRQHDPALAAAVEDDLDVLQAAVVLAQARAGHALHADVHRAPLGERLRPDAFVEVLDRPEPGRLAARRREIGEIEQPVAGEIRVEHDVVQALRADDLDARHAGNRQRDHAVGWMIRIAPTLSLTSKFPSGRNATHHGLLSRLVIVSIVKGGDGFAGGGALVWPGKAGRASGV